MISCSPPWSGSRSLWYGNSSPTLAVREFLVLSKGTWLSNSLHTGQWLIGISEIIEWSEERVQCMLHHRYTHMETWTNPVDKDTATAAAIRMSTDKALPLAALTFRSHTDGHLLLFLGWQSLEFTSVAHTPIFPASHTHLWFPQALAAALPQWLEIKVAAGSCSWRQDSIGSRSRHQGPGVLTAPLWV